MDKWIFRILGLVIPIISPELRKALEAVINELETQAKKTANPWDDILVGLLKTVLFNK